MAQRERGRERAKGTKKEARPIDPDPIRRFCPVAPNHRPLTLTRARRRGNGGREEIGRKRSGEQVSFEGSVFSANSEMYTLSPPEALPTRQK